MASINATKLTNCLTEIMFDEAICRAEFLDNYLLTERRPFGPFHGIPFSLKDTFDVADYDSTIGLIKNCFSPKKKTADIVKFIIDSGGIIFVKTNVPQTLMSFECSNPVWGVTSNFFDNTLSPGGSSGGEASLIAAGGSMIGIGSDIGGSLRIPAHFSGICSFKPSYNRLSNIGTSSYKNVNIGIEPVIGPMAKRVTDLKFFCKSAFGHSASDVFPLKFRQDLVDNNNNADVFKFGYCVSGPFNDASPLCRRAVLDTVERLKCAGFNVVEFIFPDCFNQLTPIFYQLISADGWKFYLEKLKGEKIESYLKNLIFYAKTPNCFKSIISLFAKLIFRDQQLIDIISSISEKDVYQMHKIQIEIEQIRANYEASVETQGIDFLIAPVHTLPATPLGSFGNIHFCAAFTFIWNMLNVPIGVLPVARFDAALDTVPDKWPRKFGFKDLFKQNVLGKVAQNYYNSRMTPGLPAGIQVIGKTNEDEKVLGAMFIIEELFKCK